MSRLANSIALVALVLLAHRASFSAERTSLTPAMVSAIRRIAPDALVLAIADVDANNCDNIPADPGLVVADFNGDGRPDFAVLVKTGVSGNGASSEGRNPRLVKYAFAIFVNDGNGGFVAKRVQRFEDQVPLAAFIESQSAGTIRDRDTGKHVTIRNPAVALVFCDKSVSLYHFVGQRIHVVQLGD
jgi:hypothetical protein